MFVGLWIRNRMRLTRVSLHLQALDSCRLDRMPHVRAAVSEALHTAKMLASGDPTRTSVGIAASPVRKSSERGRGGWNEDALLSPASKRGHSPRSPASSTSASESRQIPSSPARSTDRRPKRTPLHSARGMGFVQSPRSASSPSTSPSSSITEECESPSHRCECKNFARLLKKKNVQFVHMCAAHSHRRVSNYHNVVNAGGRFLIAFLSGVRQ